jgi:hypothetical protein
MTHATDTHQGGAGPHLGQQLRSRIALAASTMPRPLDPGGPFLCPNGRRRPAACEEGGPGGGHLPPACWPALHARAQAVQVGQ